MKDMERREEDGRRRRGKMENMERRRFKEKEDKGDGEKKIGTERKGRCRKWGEEDGRRTIWEMKEIERRRRQKNEREEEGYERRLLEKREEGKDGEKKKEEKKDEVYGGKKTGEEGERRLSRWRKEDGRRR